MFCSSPEAMFVSTANSLSFTSRLAKVFPTFTLGDQTVLAVNEWGRLM